MYRGINVNLLLLPVSSDSTYHFSDQNNRSNSQNTQNDIDSSDIMMHLDGPMM